MPNQDPFGLQDLRTSIQERPQRTYGNVQTVAQQMAGEREDTGFLKAIVKPAEELGKDIAELFPEVKGARRKIQELRDTGDAEMITIADDLEKQLGRKPTLSKVIGDVAGTALLAIPIPGLKFLKVAPTLRTFVAGGLWSSGFGAAEALSQDKDSSQVLSQAVVSGLIGAPLVAGGGLVMKYGGRLVGKGVSKVGLKIPEALKPIHAQLSNMGKAGQILSENFRKIQISSKQKAGVWLEKLSNVGLFKITRLTPLQKKPVPLISKEAAWLGKNSLLDVLEGRATLKNATVEVKAAYKIANQMRNELGQSLKEGVGGFTLRKNFFSRITPDAAKVQLSSTEKLALKGAKTAQERVAIHLQSAQRESLRRRVLLNAVEKRKAFSSVEKAAETLDGWAEWVTSAGRIEKRGGVERMVNYLVASGQVKSKSAALSKMRKMFIEGRSSLLKERTLDFPFYDPDPRIVLPTYIIDATLKIEQNKFLSKKVQQSLLNQIQRDSGFDAYQKTTELIDNVTGAISRAPAGEKLSIFMRSLQVPKLSFAQILNLGQNINTYLATDLGSISYGLAKSFTEKGVRSALKSGATLQTLIRQQTTYIGGGSGFADKFLKYSGFTWTEMFNRTVASNAGQKYAQQVANRLVASPTNRYLRWQLKELGIPDERISQIVKGVNLTNDEILQAGAIMSRETQFLSDPLNLPGFASSPWGKVFTQYKNFSYNQTRFIYRQLATKPTLTQKLRTVLILSTLFPMVGEVTSDIRSLITGSKRPTKAFDRYMENITNAGTFGLALDLWESAEFGATTEALVGPTFTSIGNLADSHMRSITTGEIDPALKFWLRQTGVGRVITNRVWESKVKGRGGVFEFWEEL